MACNLMLLHEDDIQNKFSSVHVHIIFFFYLCKASVPACLDKEQGAKEIGRNLVREKPKFGHNLVRKRHKIAHSLESERPSQAHFYA